MLLRDDGQGDFHLAIIDREGSIIDKTVLGSAWYSSIELLDDNAVLVVSNVSLFRYDDLVLTASSVNEYAIDVTYHLEEGIIEILSGNKILIEDIDLLPLYEIDLPYTENERVSSYYENGINYVLSKGDDISYITSYDSIGTAIQIHAGLIDHKYSDLLIQNNRFNFWGVNDCWGSSNFLKMDIDGFDSEIILNDLTIEFFEATLDTLVYDTIIWADGSETIRKELFYNWKVLISNSGDNTVNRLNFVSNRPSIGRPMYIYFETEETLEPGQSVEYTGDLSVYESVFSNYIHLAVSSDLLDANCDDNRTGLELLTSTVDIKVNDWSIYPNPSSSIINLPFDDETEYQIFDLTGRCVQQSISRNYQIDISSLSDGIYFISVSREGNHRTIKKFIKGS